MVTHANPMDDKTFDTLVAQLWRRLTDAVDTIDPDIVEATATPDMVTLEIAGGKEVVINTQRAVHQVWVAVPGHGLHFSWDPDRQSFWDDKRQGLELFAYVAGVLRGLAGVVVHF
jgi:iron donor protein CyaY